ncbi:FAD/NAD(P)-binding domain-containing protein [Thozetella sp. PMI_491]|nr:FAD/NAD(P)-binding domain-containing protein [Thozetella sp. PMI_491]
MSQYLRPKTRMLASKAAFSPMTTPLKVLIVGGGVAGPSLAYWLSRLNTDVTVIERFSQMRANGQQLDLRSHGVPMMKKMGMETAVRAAAVHEPGMQFIDQNGKTKAYFPAIATNTSKQSMTSEFEIMRGDMVRILYGLTENNQKVRHVFGTSVKDLRQDDESDPNGKVHVRFSDDREEDFDLVVGADGSGSATRKMILDPDAPDPRESLDAYIGWFTVPARPGDSDRWTFCHLPGRRSIGTRRDCADVVRVYMILAGRKPELDAAHRSGNLAEIKNAWTELYRDGGWESKRFMHDLLHAPEADDLYSCRIEQIKLPEGGWSKGRIVLLGDSAFSQGPNGLGASLGMVGAYVLAGEMATLAETNKTPLAETVVQAAKNYEAKIRPLIKITEGGFPSALAAFFPQSNLGIKVLQTVLGAAAFLRINQWGSPAEKSEKWALPEYPLLS